MQDFYMLTMLDQVLLLLLKYRIWVLLPPLHRCNVNVNGNSGNSQKLKVTPRLETDNDDDGGGSCDGDDDDDWTESISLLSIYPSGYLRIYNVEMSVNLCWSNTCSCHLDGAKKPWDRANSADRSMVSRWELEAAQLSGYVCEAE